MTRDQQRLTDCLGHIQDAIERIGKYVEDFDEVDFLRDKKTQDAVICNLEVIGEASHDIETRHPAFVVAYPELPVWPAYEMRNAIAHGYFKVDLEVVSCAA